MFELEIARLGVLNLAIASCAALVQALLLMVFLRWASRPESNRRRVLTRHLAGAGWALALNVIVLALLAAGARAPAWSGWYAWLEGHWPLTVAAWLALIALAWILGVRTRPARGS